MSNLDIAVIGISIRFPEANTLHELWRGLVSGKDYVRYLPDSRRRQVESYYQFAYKKQPEEIPQAAYLEKIDQFDNQYFSINDREAKYIDPAHRIFLETAFHCIEDAGYMGDRIRGSNTGVFVGYGGDTTYSQMINQIERENINSHATGLITSFITSRLSYLYDLKGPAMTVDTSCSSSLVALHLACQSIRAKECDMAIVGGAQIYSLPVYNGDLGVRSPDYRTRSFDNDSDGTGSGEGVCAMILKNAAKSIEDNDHIYAIIKGSAIGSDGNAAGITVPNLIAQKNVIVSAWENAGVAPRTITYLEAHGTGTRIGDPIELNAATQAFKMCTQEKGFCAVSSVKSNIGHLGFCSGLAGVVKAVLQLKNKTIVSTVHFKELNRNILLNNSALYINKKTKPWQRQSFPRRCGVSSFGISGTNCHVILEESIITKPKRIYRNNKLHIFLLSSSWKEGLNQNVSMFIKWLQENQPDIGDVCFTLATGRTHHQYRLAVIASKIDDLIEKLTAIKCGNADRYHLNIFASDEAVNTNKVKELDYGGTFTLSYLQEIGQDYIKGIDIKWCNNESHGLHRLSLPGTALNSKSCRIEFSVGDCANNSDHQVDGVPKDILNYLMSMHRNGSELDKSIITLLFQKYIGLDHIGPNDNLYDLGGDSIIALQILKNINEIFQLHIKPADFLAYQSVNEILGLINEK